MRVYVRNLGGTPEIEDLAGQADVTQLQADVLALQNPACFSAHKNGTNQTGVPSATFTQITFSTEIYDVGGFFASSAWTPPAGKVSLILAFYATGTITTDSLVAISIHKNGASFKQAILFAGSNECSGFIAMDDDANGTDVYTGFGYVTTSAGNATFNGLATHTFFMGHVI